MSGSADVIELGSSDEEPEPATKKPKFPNAMVSIPNFIPGSKTQISKGSIHAQRPFSKVKVASSVQNLMKNPFANKEVVTRKLINGKPGLPQQQYPLMSVPRTNHPTKVQTSKNMKKSIVGKNIVPQRIIGKNVMNPASFVTAADMMSAKMILKGLQSTKPQPMHTSIPIKMAGNVGAKVMAMRPQIENTSRHIQAGGKTANKSMVVRNAKDLSGLSKNVSIKSTVMVKSIASPSTSGPPQLPPGITVTRVTGPTKKRRSKRPPSPAKVTFKKQKLNSVGVAEVPTVELDDDDEDSTQIPTSASPQWYVRPEEIEYTKKTDSKKVEEPANPELISVEEIKEPESVIIENPGTVEQIPNMQAENDKEPEKGEQTMIEITIDDSPIKPPPISQAKMVSDLSIILEDSPKKPDEKLKKSCEKKERGRNEKKEVTTSPHSRKKLNFPKNTPEFIEVEVDFLNPIDIPLETNIPIADIINLDTPTKPMEESLESVSLKSKLSTAIKKNVSVAAFPLNKELNLDLNSMGIQEKSGTNKTIETKKPEIIEDILNSKDTNATTNAEFKKVITSKKPQCKTIEPSTEVQGNACTLTIDKEHSTVNESKINEVESAEEAKTKNLNTIEVNHSERINSEVQDSLQINKVNKPESTSKDKKIHCSGEFNEIYQEFIDLCFKIEKSDDMTKIVEKKVKEYYRQVDKSFTESKDFIDIVSAKIVAINLNPENLYLYIKDIVDELKMRRKQSKGKIEVKEKAADVSANVSLSEGAEESDCADSSSRNIHRLEKTMRKLHRAIHKLEEEEVDFDDDTESVYLLTERYKARFVRVHAKLLQLMGTRMPSESKVKLEARPGRPAGPTQRLEKWINKRVPIGAPLPFPDFHDVVRCVKEANAEDRLGWSEMEVMEEARDLFSRCGKKLQQRRQANEWRLASSRISAETDPADISPELKHKLDDNKKLAAKRESDIINKYADRQNQLQLEAVEINENEADNSAPSSDDDVQAIEDEDNATKSNRMKTLSPHKEKVQAKVQAKTPEIATNPLNKENIQKISPEMATNCLNKETVELKSSEITSKSPDKDQVQMQTPQSATNHLEKEKVQSKSSDTAIRSLNKETVPVKSPETSTISEDKIPNIVLVEDKDPTDSKQRIELETVKQNGVPNNKAIVTHLEDNSIQTTFQTENATRNAFESEEEDMQLVLSDEDSNESVKNIDSDGQSLLQKMSDVENITSVIESSDTDAPIAISESHESSDSHHRSIKSSNVVSIENSSSGTDMDKQEVKQSSSSKEKQSLLEIDDSEEESANQAKQSGNSTENENDNVSYENVLIGTTEEESNACEESREVEFATMPRPNARNAEEKRNSCEPTNSEIISKTCGNLEPIKDVREAKSNENDSPKTRSSSDKVEKLDVEAPANHSKQEEIVDECDLDTENSNSQSVDDNENNSSSENQNSDIPMNIGPTEFQGKLCVRNENNTSSSYVPSDTRCTVSQGSPSIDDEENTSSSENQNCDVPMDIGPTIIQGKFSVNDDENSCDDNQNIDDENNSSSGNQNCDVPIDIGPTIIQGTLSVNDDENSCDDNQNIDDENNSSSENQNCDVPIDIGPTIIQGTLSVNDDENSCDDNHKIDNENNSSCENQNCDVPMDIGPTIIQGTLSVNDDENSCDDNRNIDMPLESGQGEDETTASDSETAPETVETTSTHSQSVEILSDTDQIVETGNKGFYVEVISHSQTETDTLTVDNSSSSVSETISHRTMDVVASEIDSIKVQNDSETSSSVSSIAPPQLNIALVGD